VSTEDHAWSLTENEALQRLDAWKGHWRCGGDAPGFPEPLKVHGLWHAGPRWACACGEDHGIGPVPGR
jgi:hypothetical protein